MARGLLPSGKGVAIVAALVAAVVVSAVAVVGSVNQPDIPARGPSWVLHTYAANPRQAAETPAVLQAITSVVVGPAVTSRIDNVQGGSAFEPEVQRLTATNPSFVTQSMQARSVIFESPATCAARTGVPTCATVVYSLTVGNQVVSSNQESLMAMTAVGWRMQASSYCQLLQAVGGTCPAQQV